MKNYIQYFKELWRGKDAYRVFMNSLCENYELSGAVLDVGSGKTAASYHRFFRRKGDAHILPLDLGFSEDDSRGGRVIDFEKDKLPFHDGSADVVLAFNVLEHIFNYNFLIGEMARVMKPGGKLIGAVPFLVGYHPDPHDFWRYTGESLVKIFSAHGFKNISISSIGIGPNVAAFSQVEFLMPRILKMIFLPCAIFCDRVILKFKPSLTKEKFALGLFFACEKS